MADLRDILSDDEEQLNEDELMKYLDNNLSEEEKLEFEKRFAASSFENDAVDGLKSFKNKQSLNDYVNQINRNLDKQLQLKKQKNEKRKIKDFSWIILTVILILFICVIGYFVIHLYNQSAHRSHNHPPQTTQPSQQ
jgi:hypothetical protein